MSPPFISKDMKALEARVGNQLKVLIKSIEGDKKSQDEKRDHLQEKLEGLQKQIETLRSTAATEVLCSTSSSYSLWVTH